MTVENGMITLSNTFQSKKSLFRYYFVKPSSLVTTSPSSSLRERHEPRRNLRTGSSPVDDSRAPMNLSERTRSYPVKNRIYDARPNEHDREYRREPDEIDGPRRSGNMGSRTPPFPAARGPPPPNRPPQSEEPPIKEFRPPPPRPGPPGPSNILSTPVAIKDQKDRSLFRTPKKRHAFHLKNLPQGKFSNDVAYFNVNYVDQAKPDVIGPPIDLQDANNKQVVLRDSSTDKYLCVLSNGNELGEQEKFSENCIWTFKKLPHSPLAFSLLSFVNGRYLSVNNDHVRATSDRAGVNQCFIFSVPPTLRDAVAQQSMKKMPAGQKRIMGVIVVASSMAASAAIVQAVLNIKRTQAQQQQQQQVTTNSQNHTGNQQNQNNSHAVDTTTPSGHLIDHNTNGDALPFGMYEHDYHGHENHGDSAVITTGTQTLGYLGVEQVLPLSVSD
ncbi:hypothetical protein BKA69DRAFT_330169 [Paraphysoderma sedebokerense]|nr:hypothetical protein BKA69DRAFT_330169 [Paraphysoderma sedebokerense]